MFNQEKYLHTAEKYHTHQNSKKGLQINDSTIAKNKIFEVIVKHNPQ